MEHSVSPAEKTGRRHEWLDAATAERLKPSAPIAAGNFALCLFFYLVSLVGAVADLPIWLNVIFSLANGLAIGLLFIIGHDAVHQSFFPGVLANQIVARIALLPQLHSASLWELGHNRSHHRKTNCRSVDYVWAPATLDEYRRMSPARRLVERIYRGPLGPFFYYQIEIWFKRMLLPLHAEARKEWRRHVFDSAYVFVAGAVLLAGIACLGLTLAPLRSVPATIGLGFALPFAIWGYLGGLTFYLQHTHPNAPWFDDAADWSFYRGVIRGTVHARNVIRGVPIYAQVMEHNAHHSAPTIPVYRLPLAQEQVARTYPGEFVRFNFTAASYLRIVSACKLFDYDHCQWIDFAGRPTGPALREPALANAASNPFARAKFDRPAAAQPGVA